jgi:hypothetical protein
MIYYTNTKRTDGFGAQYQNIIWCILYYAEKNLPFLYTPFRTVEHNYTNDPSYMENLDTLINIKSYIPCVNKYPNSTITDIERADIYNEIESNMDKYHSSPAFYKIKEAFYDNKMSLFNPNYLNVAVHIRVSNQVDVNLPSFRKTDLHYYNSIMNHIKNINKDKNIRFHVYSQGKPSDFSQLEQNNIIFHLNECVGSTFTDMVFADILVASKSSLSYVAGLLNNNEVYYIPFLHPPLKHWKIFNI